jgi:hypothetical protein
VPVVFFVERMTFSYYYEQMWRKVLSWLASTSWLPFLAPCPRISPVEIPTRLAMWKIQTLLVAQWTGDDEWSEELTKTAEHVKKWKVPLGRRMDRDYPPR